MKMRNWYPVSVAAALAVFSAFMLHAGCGAAPDIAAKAGSAPLVTNVSFEAGETDAKADSASLIANGSFEAGDTDPTGWTTDSADPTHHVSLSTTVFHSSKRAAMTVVDAGAASTHVCYNQYVPVKAGNTYTFTAWVKEDNVQGNAGWFLHVYKGHDVVVNQGLNTNNALPGWSQVSTTVQVPDGGDTIQVGTSLYGTGTAYFDDAKLVLVPKTVALLPAAAPAPYHVTASAGRPVGSISPVIPFGYGINIHEMQFPPAEYKLFHRGGFGLIRTDFHWQDIEPTPGIYDFRKYDAQLKQLETLGVRPVWPLSYTNTNYDNNEPPHTPEGLQAFANFARAAAAHFQNCGVIWEIWNEPNEPNFWSTGPNADQYAALVKASVPAIRASDPKAVILAGSISQCNIPYITTFLKDNPLQGVTALSVHPYREGQPETVLSDYAQIRALIARYTPAGQRPVPIVCSEWGYTTAVGQTSEADQGRYLTRLYLANLLSGVNMTINYDWTDDGPDPANNENRYGILNQDLTPKPAYTEVSALLNTLTGYRFRHRIRGAASSDYKLLFQGPQGLAVVSWTSDETASAEAQTPRITLIGNSSPSYASLMPLALAKTSADDRPYPDVLPKIPGVVTLLTSTSIPPPQQVDSATTLSSGQPLLNSGFETGTSGWVPSPLDPGQHLGITDAVMHSGTRGAFMSAKPGTTPSWFNWGQTVTPVVPGDQYTFTAWLKKADVHGASGWYIHVNGADGKSLYNNTLAGQAGYSDWKKVTANFTVPAGGVSITVGTCLYGSGAAYFDDASLVKTGHT